MLRDSYTVPTRVSPVALELGGDIVIAVLGLVAPPSGQASYHLVSYTPLTYTRSDVAIFLRNGDFKVVKRDDCNLI